MATQPAAGPGGRLRLWWQRLVQAVSWAPPTASELGVVAKAGLAAGLSWWIAGIATDVPDPVLAPLTAVVVVQVAAWASVRTAIQRSAGVVLGVILALAIGDALGLNALTVGVLVAASLGIAQLVLRLPPAAARQVPVSILAVLTGVTTSSESYGWQRVLEAVVGAAVGIAVALTLPGSRVVNARQSLSRLGDGLGGVLDDMGTGLQEPWSSDQAESWRRRARTVRTRLVGQAAEAVGNGRESARWNLRDRRHIAALGRYEKVMPRLERTAIGVSVISRGLDDHVRLVGTTHHAMASMGALLVALAGAIRTVVEEELGDAEDAAVARALAEVRARRDRCVHGASRRARLALDRDEGPDGLEGEWLGYAALLVQVDRIVGDLSAPLPQ